MTPSVETRRPAAPRAHETPRPAPQRAASDLQAHPAQTGFGRLAKRALHLAGATVALALSAPICVLIALAIKLDSSGPVLFRQERVGLGGRRFRVLKFRTMRDGVPDDTHRKFVTRLVNGDHSGGRKSRSPNGGVYKLVGDSRVTRVGRLLRRTSLDELPQLVNVLRAEMSLVGPRPVLPYEVDEYKPWQLARLTVLPGITGLWQVSGRSRVSYEQMCVLDIQYVENWTFGLDFQILLRTIPVVLLNSGAAE